MSYEEALKIIQQALNQGFKNGAYSLEDAAFIVQALTVITTSKQNTKTE